MGSVRKRGPSQWQGRYRDATGRSHAKTFPRKQAAQAWLATVEVSKGKGQWVDPRLGKATFAAWAAQWERTVVGLRPATLDRDRRTVRNHLVPRFGPYPLSAITPAAVRAWVAELAAGVMAPATVRKTGQVMAKVMAAAVADGVIARSPCEGVRLPAEDRRDMRFLSPDEVVALADAIDPHYRTLVLTAAYCGLRWSELARLRAVNVDLGRGVVNVVEQMTEVGGQLHVGPPKTAAGRRSVSVPASMVPLLEKLPPRGTFLFTAKEGGPLMRSNFRRRAWLPATSAVGLEGLRFHDLRHTAVALAIGQGAHPRAIMERMGHSSITTTLDRYGHLFPGLDTGLLEGLDDTLRRSLVDKVWTSAPSTGRNGDQEPA